MGKRPKPTLRAQWLGQQLRELREGSEMTLREVGEYLQRDLSMVSRFETADYPIRREDVLALLELYGVSDQRQRAGLLKLSEDVSQKGWWDGYAKDVAHSFVDYVWLESRAQEIRAFKLTAVPGLLQTRGYTEAVISAAHPTASSKQLNRWADLRTTRHDVLKHQEPLRLSVVLDEASLRRAVGGPEIMRTQLHYLYECSMWPNIEIRVLPFGAGAHTSIEEAFHVFVMDEPYPDVAYVETGAGAIYVESPDAEPFVEAYHRLKDTALDPQQSAELISATAEDFQ